MSVIASTTVSTVPRATASFSSSSVTRVKVLQLHNRPAPERMDGRAGPGPRARRRRAEAGALRYSRRRMDRRSTVNTLAGLRLAIGVASWATPRAAGKLFGLDAAANPQAPYLARLFGARDVALAWGALGSEGDTQRQWLLAGFACDLADTLAGIAGGRGGYLPKLTSVLVSGTALSAAALGGAALRES